MRALDAARASLGLRRAVLPKDFLSLSPDRQIFILANLDRITYGLTPIAGLNTRLSAAARPGMLTDTDPAPTRDFPTNGWASNVVWGIPPLLGYFMWMYGDGYPGNNLACTTPTSSGCWGHRHNLLAFPTSTRVAMGVATGTDNSGKPAASAIVARVTAAVTYYYTWSDAVADGAGVQAGPPQRARQGR